jgi:histidinol-phosphate aminotransferase
MKSRFKTHINNMVRYQTSLGRDLVNGWRLDRNEKVSNFPPEVFADILKSFPPTMISASPEAAPLYEKIAKFLNIDQHKIYLSCGITEGVRFIYETVTNPGENIIVLDPTYPMYKVYAEFFQLQYRPFSVDKNLKPDLNALYAQVDNKTALIAIANPNLPIETALTKAEILPILEFAKARNIIVIIDEAYHYFGAETVIDLVDQFDNLIVMRTFSKAFGGAGLRLGFMISQKQNIEYFSKTRSIVESNTFSMRVGEYLIEHPKVMQDHVKEVKTGARYLQQELTRLGLRWHGGDYTNGILIFLKSPAQSKEAVAHLKEQKIYIRGSFEAPFDSCIRVSIGEERAMRVFIEAFSRWYSQSYANSPV